VAELQLTPEAEDDIAQAEAWYAAKQLALSDRFLSAIRRALDRILKLPTDPTSLEVQ